MSAEPEAEFILRRIEGIHPKERTRFAVNIALSVYSGKAFTEWAHDWLRHGFDTAGSATAIKEVERIMPVIATVSAEIDASKARMDATWWPPKRKAAAGDMRAAEAASGALAAAMVWLNEAWPTNSERLRGGADYWGKTAIECALDAARLRGMALDFTSLYSASLLAKPAPFAPGRTVGREYPPPEAAYKKDDIIGGKYEVYRLLGMGGFGEVYLVYSHEDQSAYALKTFRQEFLADVKVKAGFKREALLWLNLGMHPFILAARQVEEFSGRLFVAMDYIAPDERGRVTLADHLAYSHGPLDTDRALALAIQFCHGMEHAHQRGIKCHRDIKPTNILIRQERTLLITDFGLAAAAEEASSGTVDAWEGGGDGGRGSFGLAVFETAGTRVCGTPGYMAPEVFRGQGADVRSDIYSFGLVLWQMASGSQVPPFVQGVAPPESSLDVKRYVLEIYRRQMSEQAQEVGKPLEILLGRCLAPEPFQRYESFRELREELETAFHQRTGRTLEVPATYVWAVPFWINKGASYRSLGRYDEAVTCFRKALEIEPDDAPAHQSLGTAFHAKGDLDGAIAEYDTAIRLQPNDAAVHSNLGTALKAKGDLEGAIAEWRAALAIEPNVAGAHANLGMALHDKGDLEEAIAEYRTAIRLEPDLALAHYKLADALQTKLDIEGAITEYRRAIGVQPDLAGAHVNLGVALQTKGNLEGAIAEYRTALRLRPDYAGAHTKLGDALQGSGDLDGAVAEYRMAIRLQPDDADAYCNLGNALQAKRDLNGAIAEYRTALRLQPDFAIAHNNLGVALITQGDREAAAEEFLRAYSLAPNEPAIRQAYEYLVRQLKR